MAQTICKKKQKTPQKTSSAVKRLEGLFCCCCFYRDVNTRGRHSMMCTLWMGWWMIDSMTMEKRQRGGWEGGESEERSWRWVCWCVSRNYPSTAEGRGDMVICSSGRRYMIYDMGVGVIEAPLSLDSGIHLLPNLHYWFPFFWLLHLCVSDPCENTTVVDINIKSCMILKVGGFLIL